MKNVLFFIHIEVMPLSCWQKDTNFNFLAPPLPPAAPGDDRKGSRFRVRGESLVMILVLPFVITAKRLLLTLTVTLESQKFEMLIAFIKKYFYPFSEPVKTADSQSQAKCAVLICIRRWTLY